MKTRATCRLQHWIVDDSSEERVAQLIFYRQLTDSSARRSHGPKSGAYLNGDNWVSMPRAILKKHDVSVGDLGKIVAMYIRVAEVLSHVPCRMSDGGAPAAPVVGVHSCVPVAEPA